MVEFEQASDYEESLDDSAFDFPVEPITPVITDDIASERAAYTALLSDTGAGLMDKYAEVKASILAQGTSEEYDNVRDSVLQDNQNLAVDAAVLLSKEASSPEEVASIASIARESINSASDSLADEVSIRSLSESSPSTKESVSVQDLWGEKLDEELAAYAEIGTLVADTVDDLEMSWGMVGDGLLTMAPLYEGLAFREFVDSIGVEHNVAETLVPGELLVKLRSHVQTMIEDGRTDELPEFYRDMSLSLQENAGVFGGNEFVRITALLDTFAEVTGDLQPDEIDWSRWLMDIGGALDASLFGGVAFKGISRLLRVGRGSRLSRIRDANPDAAATLAAAAARNDAATEALGETPTTLRSKLVLPKDAKWQHAQTPEAVRQSVLAADESTDVLSIADRVDDFIGQESAIAAEGLRKDLLNAEGGSTWVADTSLTRTSQGWRAEATVGANDTTGWGSLEAATLANKEMFDGKATIVARDLKNNKLLPTGTSKGKVVAREGDTEWFLKVKHDSDIVFMDDDFGISAGGKFRKHLFDPDSRFASWISTRGNAVFDQYKLLEKTLEDKFNPIANLANDDKLVVSKLLSRGLQRERVYTSSEVKHLARASGTKEHKLDSVVDAYRSARSGFDTMYLLEERLFRKGLTKEGYSSVVRSGEFTDFAKPLELDAARGIKRVYDPSTNSIVDAPDISGVYSRNQKVVQLRSPVLKEGEQARYVVLSGDSKLEDMPLFSLSYRQGWVPTMYKENYFVTKTSNVLDQGQSVPRVSVMEVAHTRNEALNRVSRLNENAEDGVVYEFKHDRQLTSDQIEEATESVHRSNGKLFFSRRGERLKNEDGSLARIQDPLEAAINGARTVSRRTAMDSFIQDLKTRYINTFGSYTENQFTRPYVVKDMSDGAIAKANSMFDYIEQLSGIVGKGFEERKNLIKLADWAEPKPVWGKTFAEGARAISDKVEVTSWVRGKNFEFNLGTDPIRQMIVQPSQVLFTAALDPLNTAHNFNVGRIVTTLAKDPDIAKRSIEDFNSVAKVNMTRLDGKELKALVDEFRQTGLGQAVTSHQVARDSAKPLSVAASGSKVERVGNAITQPYTQSIGFLRKGFERGEEINLGSHWMLARSRWMKKNPGKDPAKNVLQISGEARSLALSMTQAGDFGYQKGFMSVPLQYFSIRHKSMLALVSNKQLSKQERMQMAAGQLLLWGPEGVGLGYLMKWMREETGAEVPDIVRDGVMESLVNNMLSAATDDDVDLDIGGTFSTLKGVETDNLISATIDAVVNDGPITKLAFGPTESNFNRIQRFTDSASIAVNSDIDKVNWDVVSVAKDDFLRILSSYNRMASGLAMLRSGHWQNSKGENLFPASTMEAVMQGVLGLRSNKEEALYDLQKAIRPPGKSGQTALQETADTYYRLVLQLTNKSLAELESGLPMREVWASHHSQQTMHNAVIASMGADGEIVSKMVRDRIAKNSKGTKQDELVSKLGKLYLHKGNVNLIDLATEEGLLTEEQRTTYKGLFNHMWGVDE